MSYSIAQIQAGLTKAKNVGADAIESVIDIQLWYDVEDMERAEEFVDMTVVNSITFDENMFSVLPTMTIELTDDGTYYNLKPMKIGRKIYCKIQSSAKTNDNKEVRPLLSRMTVESITQRVDQSSGTSNMLIKCVYDAQGFINRVPIYPVPGAISLPIPENSSDAVTRVCNSVGLNCVSDLGDGMDYMNYVNGTLTAKKLVDKIVDHAWVKENDAPVFYVDLEGNAHLTSIDRMVHAGNKLHAIGQVNFSKQYRIQADKEDFYRNYLLRDSKLVYQDIKQVNLGAKINNVGGGMTKGTVYDPIGVTAVALAMTTDKATNPDVENSSSNEKPDKNYISYEGTGDTVFLGNSPNKESAEGRKLNGVRHYGIMSANNHQWYEVAPANNFTAKMSFFQNFWKITMDVNKQPGYFYTNANLMPRIGRVIEIDFTDEDYANQVYTGSYLITRVQHIWTNGNSYAIALTCCADGYYDSKPKCEFFDKCPNKGNCVRTKDYNSCQFHKRLKLVNKQTDG